MTLREIEERLLKIENEDCCKNDECENGCGAFDSVRELRRDIERDRLLSPGSAS